MNFSEVPGWVWGAGWALCGVASAVWVLRELKVNETLQDRHGRMFDDLLSLVEAWLGLFGVRLVDVERAGVRNVLFNAYFAGIVLSGPFLAFLLVLTGVPPRDRRPR